jgi:hypothetical protein
LKKWIKKLLTVERPTLAKEWEEVGYIKKLQKALSEANEHQSLLNKDATKVSNRNLNKTLWEILLKRNRH